MGNFQTYVTTSALARFGFSNRPVICVDANGEGAGVRLKRAKDCYAGRPKSAQLLTKS
jgi:hypothetical protein